jgi:hypothetical protein
MEWIIGLLSQISLVAFVAVVGVMAAGLILMRFRVRLGYSVVRVLVPIVEYLGNVELRDRPDEPPRHDAPYGAPAPQR